MSSLPFVKKIALRYLWSKRAEAFISIITVIAIVGVAIGVAVINITMGIMTGFETELRNKVVGSTHILVYKLGGAIPDSTEVLETVRDVNDVRSVSGFIQREVMLSSRGYTRGVLVRGITGESPAAHELEKYSVTKSSINELFEDRAPLDSSAPLPSIIIGHELARTLNLFVGSAVTLFAPEVSSTPFGLSPRYKRFVVSGVFKSGLSGYEEGLIYTSLESAQQFFRMGAAVSGLEIMVAGVDKAPLVAKEVTDQLARSSDGGFTAQDWTQANKNLWEAIKLEKQVYFIVLLLLVVLASFSIISTLVMIVLEKRKDIAILKTLGARTGSIANIFRLQGAVIGGLGTGLGLLFGYLGSIGLREYGFPLPENVFPTSTVPVQLEPINFIVTGVAAFLICILSTWYPARRASGVEPSEAMRYE